MLTYAIETTWGMIGLSCLSIIERERERESIHTKTHTGAVYSISGDRKKERESIHTNTHVYATETT